jgi:hypothetical protein
LPPCSPPRFLSSFYPPLPSPCKWAAVVCIATCRAQSSLKTSETLGWDFGSKAQHGLSTAQSLSGTVSTYSSRRG